MRSYRTISPLPAGKRVSSQAVSFLWHFPWPRGRLPLATTLTRGARTFLPGEDPRATVQTSHVRKDGITSARGARRALPPISLTTRFTMSTLAKTLTSLGLFGLLLAPAFAAAPDEDFDKKRKAFEKVAVSGTPEERERWTE